MSGSVSGSDLYRYLISKTRFHHPWGKNVFISMQWFIHLIRNRIFHSPSLSEMIPPPPLLFDIFPHFHGTRIFTLHEPSPFLHLFYFMFQFLSFSFLFLSPSLIASPLFHFSLFIIFPLMKYYPLCAPLYQQNKHII